MVSLLVIFALWTPITLAARGLEACGRGGAEHPDLMDGMPGFDEPLPTRWFSGYLDYELEGRKVHTHYVLVEAEPGVNAEEVPLIYWSNGGPGASSLFGLLTELGPLILSDDSLKTEDYAKTGIPTPLYNPYTWSRLGHLLIIDQPAPVGFSFCGDPSDPDAVHSHSCGGIAWTDELASLNSYTALQTFFDQKFPCLLDLDLYLTGESYGGIYIPTLARRIYNKDDTLPAATASEESDATTTTLRGYPKALSATQPEESKGLASMAGDTKDKILLKGFAVGDGCLGIETNICGGLANGNGSVFQDYWYILFMAGHHQIPLSDYQRVLRACAHADEPGFLSTNEGADADCAGVLKDVKSEMGGLFEYALYDECTYRNGLLATREIDPQLGGALNDYPCGAGPVLEQYFRLDAVKEAFHVISDFFEVDNAEGDFDYTPTEPDLSNFYHEINGKLRVLVYNGDTDPAITSFAAANWTSHLGLAETQHWRPWTVDSCRQMGGYVTRYEGDFDFLTIRGAGHMVPTYKPQATFAFLKAWISGAEYLQFDPNCTQLPATVDGIVVAVDE